MKITSSNCWVETFKFREGYAFSNENRSECCDNVFLTLETDEGLQGWGMAAPDEIVTGEDSQSVLQAYKDHIADCMQGEDPFYFSRLYEDLRDKIPGQSSALAMIEIALYDLVAQKAGVPLYQLLGGFRDKIVTSVTIGIMDDAGVLERTEKLLHQGIKAIKVRGGKDVERDIRIVDRKKYSYHV